VLVVILLLSQTKLVPVLLYQANILKLKIMYFYGCHWFPVVLPVAMTKLFRIGRQEDAHEFLRYYVDSMQKACLKDLPTKYVCACVRACVRACVW